MTTRPNIMMTLVISATVSALILANSAPAQAGGHHEMMREQATRAVNKE